ncbi:uncharacterized protein LOC103307898 [Acyrthosiphon pisum]|uniref:Integrase zinc-binding domain-containing protein n=1 Tax=Acyrthosiphon pisum TaxID=7029 RepID=A0A8R1X0B9_ACYPI|nr:uncharacterized protein LOC103307898 [Acyrthosiphon pisum]|eukprot:XP_008178571.1 PREDICTED: uncharacterized protein LOC103307898 [Acyrthosiphon pisum]
MAAKDEWDKILPTDLATQLARKTVEAWGLSIKDIQLWTSSMVVLGWFKSQISRLKTYVANRINQIMEITESEQWRHVRIDENPADILSQGVTPRELQDKVLWWYGPHWLAEEENQWIQHAVPLISKDQMPERRPIKLVLVAVNYLDKLLQVKRSGTNVTQYLVVSELRSAENILIKRTQADEFSLQLLAKRKQREIPKCSKLNRLHPLLRKDGPIVIGVRLENADLDENQIHPIVLQAKHKITRLIFEDHHQALLHCGPQMLLAKVRQCYLPLRGRIMAHSTVTRCINCVRARPRFETPLMAPLLKQRVQMSRPFTIAGVDFAEPLQIQSDIRRVTTKKGKDSGVCMLCYQSHTPRTRRRLNERSVPCSLT